MPAWMVEHGEPAVPQLGGENPLPACTYAPVPARAEQLSVASHLTNPAEHVKSHVPLEHTSVPFAGGGDAVLQSVQELPQCDTSVFTLSHVLSGHCLNVGSHAQPQFPVAHLTVELAGPVHCLPQVPQLFGSFSSSTQPRLQSLYPLVHV
jgi:hypothetical protein